MELIFREWLLRDSATRFYCMGRHGGSRILFMSRMYRMLTKYKLHKNTRVRRKWILDVCIREECLKMLFNQRCPWNNNYRYQIQNDNSQPSNLKIIQIHTNMGLAPKNVWQKYTFHNMVIFTDFRCVFVFYDNVFY